MIGAEQDVLDSLRREDHRRRERTARRGNLDVGPRGMNEFGPMGAVEPLDAHQDSR